MKEKSASNYTIIGGVDGPTSVFIMGEPDKKWDIRGIKNMLYNKRYQKRRKKVMATITANPHSLDEVISYITTKYQAIELSQDSREYQRRRKDCKAGFVLRFKPELVGGLDNIEKADFEDEISVREYFTKIEEQQEKAAAVSDEIFPIDFHIYKIQCADGGKLEVEMEKIHEHIGLSMSAPKGKMKQVKKIGKDIYRYYGVSEHDIENKTERYKHVVAALAGE